MIQNRVTSKIVPWRYLDVHLVYHMSTTRDLCKSIFFTTALKKDLDMFVKLSLSLKTDRFYFKSKRSTCCNCLLL